MYYYRMYSKELLKGTISVIILQLLAENGPMYGYEIYQEVKKLSDDKIILKDGSLYPALQRLRRDGLLAFREEYIGKRVRKYYHLTAQGEKEKSASRDELRDFISTISRIVFPEFRTA